MRRSRARVLLAAAVATAVTGTVTGGAATATATAATTTAGGEPRPSDPAYTARDLANIADAYGRVQGPGGQLRNAAYLPALVQAVTARSVQQMLTQVASPTRPAITAGNFFPGWNVGNPLRDGWSGTRGLSRKVAFTNQYGALLRGTVWRPKPGARDPYTGRVLRGPFPGVVLTEGSVQGSEGMYEWLAQDLAERGYVVLTYDVQGQGTSETLPHETGEVFPTCDPTAEPAAGEMTGCPGVPFQQVSNFVVGTRNALGFFTSTPSRPYANPSAAPGEAIVFNPYWRLFDRSPDRRTATPGRTTRIAIIGHSLGALAVSQVQATDRRVAAVVALDKLRGDDQIRPAVPALAVQSEYGFSVSPWFTSAGSSLSPQPSPEGPDPLRERATGFDAWRAAGIDSMLVVPRASTHLEYTDIPLVLPASRYGQDLTSVYTQLWLDRYLKHRDNTAALLGGRFRYLEPVGEGRWSPVTLRRNKLLSFYYCSAYSLGARGGSAARRTGDVTGVGC